MFLSSKFFFLLAPNVSLRSQHVIYPVLLMLVLLNIHKISY